LALKAPSSGQLVSLEVIEGKDAVPSAKKLLKGYPENNRGISTWDASSIFFEMHGLEIGEHASPRTLILLYAADLFFRLRWEILPAMEEGKCVVATPYIESAVAFGLAMGLPRKWLSEVFRFAPEANESYRLNGETSEKLGAPTAGFVEFCSTSVNQDLRPQFSTYFDELERKGRCRTL
jgi:hypothetical protein